MLHSTPQALRVWLSQLEYSDLRSLAKCLKVALPPPEDVPSVTHLKSCHDRILQDVNGHVDPGSWHLFLGCRVGPFNNAAPPAKSLYGMVFSQVVSALTPCFLDDNNYTTVRPQEIAHASESVVNFAVEPTFDPSYKTPSLVAHHDEFEVNGMLQPWNYSEIAMEVGENASQKGSGFLKCLIPDEAEVSATKKNKGKAIDVGSIYEDTDMSGDEDGLAGSPSGTASASSSLTDGGSSSEEVSLSVVYAAQNDATNDVAMVGRDDVQATVESVAGEVIYNSAHGVEMSSVSDAASSTVPGTSRAFEDVALALEVAQQDGNGKLSQDVVAPAIAATEVLDSAHATCGASTVNDVLLSRDADVSKSDEEMIAEREFSLVAKSVPGDFAASTASRSTNKRKPSCFNHRALNDGSERARPYNLRPRSAKGVVIPVSAPVSECNTVSQDGNDELHVAPSTSELSGDLSSSSTLHAFALSTAPASIVATKTRYAPYPAAILSATSHERRDARERASPKPKHSIRGVSKDSQQETGKEPLDASEGSPSLEGAVSGHSISGAMERLVDVIQPAAGIEAGSAMMNGAATTSTADDTPPVTETPPVDVAPRRYNLRQRSGKQLEVAKAAATKSKKTRTTKKEAQLVSKPTSPVEVLPESTESASTESLVSKSPLDPQDVVVGMACYANAKDCEHAETDLSTTQDPAARFTSENASVPEISKSEDVTSCQVRGLKRKIDWIVDESCDFLNASPRKKFKPLPIRIPDADEAAPKDDEACASDAESDHDMDVDDESDVESSTLSSHANIPMDVDEAPPMAVRYSRLEEEWSSGVVERFIEITKARYGVSPALAPDQLGNQTTVKNAFNFVEEYAYGKGYYIA